MKLGMKLVGFVKSLSGLGSIITLAYFQAMGK